MAGGSTLGPTPDHELLTDRGGRLVGEIGRGAGVARPRRFLGFGDSQPISPDHARLLGYLIGDGYVGGKTLVNFINTEPSLHDDIARIVATLACEGRPQRDLTTALSHRPGEQNGVLA